MNTAYGSTDTLLSMNSASRGRTETDRRPKTDRRTTMTSQYHIPPQRAIRSKQVKREVAERYKLTQFEVEELWRNALSLPEICAFTACNGDCARGMDFCSEEHAKIVMIKRAQRLMSARMVPGPAPRNESTPVDKKASTTKAGHYDLAQLPDVGITNRPLQLSDLVSPTNHPATQPAVGTTVMIKCGHSGETHYNPATVTNVKSDLVHLTHNDGSSSWHNITELHTIPSVTTAPSGPPPIILQHPDDTTSHCWTSVWVSGQPKYSVRYTTLCFVMPDGSVASKNIVLADRNTSRKSKVMTALDITTLITLVPNGGAGAPSRSDDKPLTVRHFKIVDGGDAGTTANLSQLTKATHAIAEASARGERVMVVCQRGTSRSAAAVLTYMLQFMPLCYALPQLLAQARWVKINAAFTAHFLALEERLRGPKEVSTTTDKNFNTVYIYYRSL